MNRPKVPISHLIATLLISAGLILYGVYYSVVGQTIDEFSFFDGTMSNILPVFFPIIISILFLRRPANELADGIIRPIRTRIELGRYLSQWGIQLAAASFGVFFAIVLINYAFATLAVTPFFPDLITPARAGEDYAALADRHRFGGLYLVHPALFGVVYSLWVATNAAAYAFLGFVGMIWISNRFVALAVPFVLYAAIGYILANLGAASFSSSYAVFGFGLQDASAVSAFPHLAFVLLLGIVGFVMAKRKSFQTPGLS